MQNITSVKMHVRREACETAGVADRQFLLLSENWALAYDKNQWIVQRARRNRNKVCGLEWRAVAFVASDKGVLHRVLREKGAVIDSEGLEALRRLPETFREWVSMPPARRFKAGHSAISGVVVGRIAPAPERSRDRAKKAA